MVFYGSSSSAYDSDLGQVLLNDYCHADYYTLLQNVVGNNVGINGNRLNLTRATD